MRRFSRWVLWCEGSKSVIGFVGLHTSAARSDWASFICFKAKSHFYLFKRLLRGTKTAVFCSVIVLLNLTRAALPRCLWCVVAQSLTSGRNDAEIKVRVPVSGKVEKS